MRDWSVRCVTGACVARLVRALRDWCVRCRLQSAALAQLPPSSQAFITEIRSSRDAALRDLDALRRDRDTIRAKLKVRTTLGLS